MDELDLFSYVVSLEHDFREDPTRTPPVAFVLAETQARGQQQPFLFALLGAEDVSNEAELVALIELHIHKAHAVAAGLATLPAAFTFVGICLATQRPARDLDGAALVPPEMISSVEIGHRNGNLYAARHNPTTGQTTTQRFARDELGLKVVRRTLGLAQILNQALNSTETP